MSFCEHTARYKQNDRHTLQLWRMFSNAKTCFSHSNQAPPCGNILSNLASNIQYKRVIPMWNFYWSSDMFIDLHFGNISFTVSDSWAPYLRSSWAEKNHHYRNTYKYYLINYAFLAKIIIVLSSLGHDTILGVNYSTQGRFIPLWTDRGK